MWRLRAGFKNEMREFRKRIVNRFKHLREIRIITVSSESLFFAFCVILIHYVTFLFHQPCINLLSQDEG